MRFPLTFSGLIDLAGQVLTEFNFAIFYYVTEFFLISIQILTQLLQVFFFCISGTLLVLHSTPQVPILEVIEIVTLNALNLD